MPKQFFRFKSLRLGITILFLLIFLFKGANANAQLFSQAPAEKQEAPANEVAPDSLGRRTPRGTVNGFFKAVADQNFIRASRYMKLKRSQQKDRERERIVKVLQTLLDHGGNIVPNSMLSDKETGNLEDDLAQEIDLVGTVTVKGNVVNLYVQNTEAPGNPAVWLFSTESIAAVSAAKVDDVLLVDRILPQPLKETLLGGVPLGHWLAVIILIVIAYLVAWAFIALISLVIRGVWKRARIEPVSGVIDALGLPFRLYISVWIFIILSQQVGISIIVRQRFSSITITIAIIAILILLWRLTDFISIYSKNRMSRRGRISAISVILFLRRTTKVALIVLGCIAILGAVGVDVTTGLAALGIGGLALALGAQKTIENFVGSVTLITDQPLRVGDYCKVGDIKGTVEQIGMRSTKIRTSERTVVTIANGDLAASRIENYAHRDRFLFDPVLEFRPDTTPDQLRYLLVELRSILYSHPMVSPEGAKVRFVGIGESSLTIEVWAYVTALDFDTFQEVQEDILLRMMDVVAGSGTDFAYPSQTIYLGRDKAKSEEKVNEVEDKVKGWKENNNMQLPGFDPDKIKELKDTIPYPPEGSVRNKVKAEDNSSS
jgi:MscS family membrane protein